MTPNILFFLNECKKRGLKVNLTLFDGNAFNEVFIQKNHSTQKFLNNIIAPLFKNIQQGGFGKVITQVEVVNEIDGLVKHKAFENNWKGASAFLCSTHLFLKKHGYASTASVGHLGAYKHILNADLPSACVDYYDLHLYNDDGKILKCNTFKKMSKNGVILQLGEFGQKTPSLDPYIQVEAVRNFLFNAQRCGFKSALAWKMDDTEDDRPLIDNYLSFLDEKFSPKPAFYFIKNFNQDR